MNILIWGQQGHIFNLNLLETSNGPNWTLWWANFGPCSLSWTALININTCYTLSLVFLECSTKEFNPIQRKISSWGRLKTEKYRRTFSCRSDGSFNVLGGGFMTWTGKNSEFWVSWSGMIHLRECMAVLWSSTITVHLSSLWGHCHLYTHLSCSFTLSVHHWLLKVWT